MSEVSGATPRPEPPSEAESPPSCASVRRHEYERAFYGGGDVLIPESCEELSDVVREAHAQGSVLIAEGAGSHAYLGVPPDEEATVVSTRKLKQILRYEPDDFTIGVEAGLPLTELRETLRQNRQEIPIDFSSRSVGTVGGWVAIGSPGLRAGHHGGLRNYVIGVRGLRGGELPAPFRTGGMVVKNVAGYDVGKFLIGSLGTAGVILETNFKLRALPDRRSLRLAGFRHRKEAWSFASALCGPTERPALLVVLGGEAASGLQGRLPRLTPQCHWVAWSFEGNTSQVAWQDSRVDAILGEVAPVDRLDLSDDEIVVFQDSLCEFSEPDSGTPPARLGIARLGVLPTDAENLDRGIFALPESQRASFATLTDVLTGLVTLRWVTPGDSLDGLLARLQALATARQATAAILYLPPDRRRDWPFSLVKDLTAPLAEKIRRVFDPMNLFCPGRKLWL